MLVVVVVVVVFVVVFDPSSLLKAITHIHTLTHWRPTGLDAAPAAIVVVGKRN